MCEPPTQDDAMMIPGPYWLKNADLGGVDKVVSLVVMINPDK